MLKILDTVGLGVVKAWADARFARKGDSAAGIATLTGTQENPVNFDEIKDVGFYIVNGYVTGAPALPIQFLFNEGDPGNGEIRGSGALLTVDANVMVPPDAAGGLIDQVCAQRVSDQTRSALRYAGTGDWVWTPWTLIGQSS